jgi:hypothetical protein
MSLKHHIVAFWTLAAAFVISALYQLYRSALMEVPEYDAFTLTTGIVYAAFIGVSALVLTDRRWAWWIVSVLVVLLLLLGVFWYYPVVVPARIEAGAMGLVGWLEGSLYMGLLFVDEFICILNLLGARLQGSER